MPRILILSIMLVSFIIAGCSKKQDEVDKLQQEAVEDEAAAVMDSLAHPQRPPDTTTTAAPEKQITKAPTTPQAEKPEPEYRIESGFVVQVGSYSDRELADYWAERYRKWGYDAFVQSADILGETYYRLRIGAFETYKEAEEIGRVLADRYSADFWVDNSR